MHKGLQCANLFLHTFRLTMSVKIAVIDSGIESSHPRIGTVAGGVKLSLDEEGNVVHSDDYEDCAGHGTACAGIIRKGVASFLRCDSVNCYRCGLLQVPVPESIPSFRLNLNS